MLSQRGVMADILPNIIDAPQRKRDKYRFRLALRAALRSATFESFLTGAIIFYALNLCTLSYLEVMPGDYGFIIHILQSLDMAIFQMFCVELLIKFFAFRRSFFRNGWNVFDAIVIIVSIIGMAASITELYACHSGYWLGANRFTLDGLCLCAHWAEPIL